MSFSDQPSYGSWRHVGCFMLVLVLGLSNALFLLSWYFSFYDLSTQQYRSLTIYDLIAPAVLIVSAAIVWLYYRFVLRN